MIQRNELAVNLARKDFHSDYTISAGYFNMGGMPPMYQFRWISRFISIPDKSSVPRSMKKCTD